VSRDFLELCKLIFLPCSALAQFRGEQARDFRRHGEGGGAV
jgi:hypothetical protein